MISKTKSYFIAPASLLLDRASWQVVLEQLPRGNVLVVLPKTQGPTRRKMRRVAAVMQSSGQAVTTISI